MTGPALILACVLDALLGEPRRAHPLVLFGTWANRVETTLHPLAGQSAGKARWLGSAAVLVATAPLVAGVAGVSHLLNPLPFHWLFDAVVVYACLGYRSLHEHARAVAHALRSGALDEARRATGWLVSRDTARLDARGCAAATTETVLENSNDAVFATLFWYAVLGAPGAVAHRLINTLDAMWGYRTTHWRHFGTAAARADDLLAWLPARLSALTWAVIAPWAIRPGREALRRTRAALRFAPRQGRRWPGVNPGIVMAAGAAALAVRLGGPAWYADGVHRRPYLGPRHASTASTETVGEALRGLAAGLILWLVVLSLPWLLA